MASKVLDHKCIICGTAYHACDSCREITTYTPWRMLCDTFDHYQVYLTIREWQEGWLTKNEAKKKLKVLGITSPAIYHNWPDGTKGLLDSIFESTKKVKSEPEDIVIADNIPSISEE